KRVMQHLQLCPERREDRNSVQAIGAYFKILNFLRSTVARIVPSMQAWTELERGQCAYFAAVTLERRISFSRDMLAQQMDAGSCFLALLSLSPQFSVFLCLTFQDNAILGVFPP